MKYEPATALLSAIFYERIFDYMRLRLRIKTKNKNKTYVNKLKETNNYQNTYIRMNHEPMVGMKPLVKEVGLLLRNIHLLMIYSWAIISFSEGLKTAK